MEYLSINTLLLVVTGMVSYLAFTNQGLFNQFKHYPYEEKRKNSFYKLLTSGFLHADWIHLLVNMYVLWMFGSIAERFIVIEFGPLFGRIIYLILYLALIVLANIPTYNKHKDNPGFASIGASGAVSGIVFIYIILYPWNKLYLYGIVPIYSIIGGVLYLMYSSWASKNKQNNIDHDAHFYGAVFGIIAIFMLKPSLISSFINQIKNVPFF